MKWVVKLAFSVSLQQKDMISKTEDLIKKVMLKARQLTETSEEKYMKRYTE